MNAQEYQSLVHTIGDFLKKNGFEEHESPSVLKNSKCAVSINYEGYSITNIEGNMHSTDHSIYWLIGNLTYRGLMDKNYKQ